MKYIEILHQNYHLQGFTTDGDYMYWSSTDCIVKTTMSGTMKAQIYIDVGHTGDIDYYDGKLYVTVLGKPKDNSVKKEWDSFSVHVYNPADLSLHKHITLERCEEMFETKEDGFRGVDGITVGVDKETGLPALMVATLQYEDPIYDKCVILQYDLDGKLQKKHYISTGNTCLGIQNLDYDAAACKYWFTTYSGRRHYQNKKHLFKLEDDVETLIAEYRYRTPVGFLNTLLYLHLRPINLVVYERHSA